MGGEAGRRSGEPTTAARGATSPSTPTPGRSTLVQALSQPQRALAADVGGSTQVQMLPQPEGAAPAPAADEAISESAALQATTDAAQGDALLQGGVARIEGDTLFCPPDGALSATTPSEASTAPKKTDADYESALGVKAAIDAKKMVPVQGVHGKTFTAVGCGGKKDGKVSFTFDRAFIGDYAYPAAGRDVRGAHVSIAVALDGCGDHSEIKLVQVLRQITKKDGKMVDREPDSAKRKERAGWSDPKAPSRGWQVDEVETGKSPFYVSDPLYGNDGSSTKAAKLRDTPGEWTTDKNVGAEFRTCAVSYAGGKGTVLACVDWGYYLDDTGKVSFYPAIPTAYPSAVPQVLDATKRWDAIAGTTKANVVK